MRTSHEKVAQKFRFDTAGKREIRRDEGAGDLHSDHRRTALGPTERTRQAAISAAETGHLVFGTLHTTGAARTVDRIVDAFPTNQQEQIRTQLSSSLVAVVSQLLLKRLDEPGRIAAFEIMLATPSIRSLIRDNKTFRITSDIQTGSRWGMMTLDAHLVTLYEKGVISYEDVITKAQDPDAVLQKLQGK